LRVGIDARYLSHAIIGGVHTYVYNFVSELAKLPSDTEFILYADTKQPFELANLPPNFSLRLLKWQGKLDSLKIDLNLKQIMAKDNLDLIHFPANYGIAPKSVANLVTLHDALNIFPLWEATKRNLHQPKTLGMILYLQAFTRLAVRNATALITVSEWAAQNITEVSNGKLPPEKIKVIYSAAAPHFKVISDHAYLENMRAKLNLPERFVLADGLKNPGVILRAWQKLPENMQKEYKIVFFSRRENLLPVARQAIAEGKVQHILKPGDAELVALYNLAAVFLFPSWIEGFGLPVLEAMACGTPVIASDRGSIPEIGGQAALYHDAEDDSTLAEYLLALLSSSSKRAELQKLGFERTAKFSWQKTARALLSIYAEFETTNRPLALNR
jgi:glycosyltransferase involved in cell wall biosynthesis